MENRTIKEDMNMRLVFFVKSRSHKYIKRTGVSGRYKYWYKDASGKLVQGKASQSATVHGISIDKEYYNKGKEAAQMTEGVEIPNFNNEDQKQAFQIGYKAEKERQNKRIIGKLKGPIKAKKMTAKERAALGKRGTVVEYSGIQFKKIGGKEGFRPIKGQKIPLKFVSPAKKELKKNPEEKVFNQQQQHKTFLRNFMNYKKGRDSSIIRDDRPKMEMSSITPQDIIAIRQDETGNLENKFIYDNNNFIMRMAYRHMDKNIQHLLDIDDLAQAGRIGIHDALQKFDVERKFDTSGGFVNYMKVAMSNKMRYYRALYMHGNVEKYTDPLSLEQPVGSTAKGDKAMELADKVPAGPTSYSPEFVEFKQAIKTMRGQLKTKKAKDVFNMLVQGVNEGYSGGEAAQKFINKYIAKKLKMSPADVTQTIKRHIRPLAKKYLLKSDTWTMFINLIEELSNG